MATKIVFNPLSGKFDLVQDLSSYVVGPASSTDNAVARFDGTTGKLIQNSGVIISDTNIVTGVEEITVNTRMEVGDPGAESSGVNIGGATYGLGLRVNDFGGSRQGQMLMHRHSTSHGSNIFGSRSNSDTSAHANVTTNMDLLGVYGTGWTDTFYSVFAAIKLKTNTTGTISSTSAPGTIEFFTSANGATSLTSRGKVDAAGTWTLGTATINSSGVLDCFGLTVTGTSLLDGITEVAAPLRLSLLSSENVIFIESGTGYAQTDNNKFTYEPGSNTLNLGLKLSLYTAFGIINTQRLGLWHENKAAGETQLVLGCSSSTAARSNFVDFIRSEGTTMGASAISASGVSIFNFRAGGFDGSSQYRAMGGIEFKSDGSVTTTSAPGALFLYTTASASVTPTQRLKLDASGTWKFQTGTYSSAGVWSGITQLNVDNLRLDGNTISSTSGQLTLSANSTGFLIIPDATTNLVTVGTAVGTANGNLVVNKLAVGNSTTGAATTIPYINGSVTGSGRGILGFTLTFTGAGAAAVVALNTLNDQGTAANFTAAGVQSQVKLDGSNHSTSQTQYGFYAQMGLTTNFTASTGTWTTYGVRVQADTFGQGGTHTGGTFRRYGLYLDAMTAIPGTPGSDLIMGAYIADSINVPAGTKIWFDSTTTALGDTGIFYSSGNTDLEVQVDGTDSFRFDADKNISKLDFKLDVVGTGLYIKEGTNATMGTATLVGGAATITTTKVTANSRIYLSNNANGGTVGAVYVSARTASTSFVITSTSGTDTSTIAWWIVEPA